MQSRSAVPASLMLSVYLINRSWNVRNLQWLVNPCFSLLPARLQWHISLWQQQFGSLCQNMGSLSVVRPLFIYLVGGGCFVFYIYVYKELFLESCRDLQDFVSLRWLKGNSELSVSVMSLSHTDMEDCNFKIKDHNITLTLLTNLTIIIQTSEHRIWCFFRKRSAT